MSYEDSELIDLVSLLELFGLRKMCQNWIILLIPRYIALPISQSILKDKNS